MLVWLGALYAPALPLFGLATNLLTFQVQRGLALTLYTPPKEHYSASRTNVVIYTLLLGAPPLDPNPSVLPHLCTLPREQCSALRTNVVIYTLLLGAPNP